jgi:hypothetical protein
MRTDFSADELIVMRKLFWYESIKLGEVQVEPRVIDDLCEQGLVRKFNGFLVMTPMGKRRHLLGDEPGDPPPPDLTRERLEADLISLAKMYGEACGELAKARLGEHQQRIVVDACQQAAGKALGYPWFKDDQRNFPGASDENGVCIGEHVEETIVEELAGAYSNLGERIKALEWHLGECINQLEYQNEKFGGTGSGDTVLARARDALKWS